MNDVRRALKAQISATTPGCAVLLLLPLQLRATWQLELFAYSCETPADESAKALAPDIPKT